MKKLAKILILSVFCISLILLFLYGLFLFILPLAINSQKFNNSIENLLYNKTGIKYTIKDLNLKTYKNLTADLSTKNILVKIDVLKKSINLTGQNIPLSYIFDTIIKIQKQKSKGKKFIENFADISGSTNINLNIKRNEIIGRCDIKDARFNFLILHTPVQLNEFPIYFNGDNIQAEAYGIIGNEKVYTSFRMQNYDAEKRVIEGYVHSDLTKRFTDKYMTDFDIDGKVDAKVHYYIKKSIPEINYHLVIKKGSNLSYRNFSLDLTDEDRRLLVKTKKDGNKLYITHYDYSTQIGRTAKNIIYGNGLFEKQNEKMKPQFITLRTQENAPVSVAGSFGEKLDGGTFNGDLYYDFNNQKIIGTFNLSNSNYEDFYIENAEIKATNKSMIINAKGTYFDSEYKGLIEAENNFKENINIYNLDLFLDSFDMKNIQKRKTRQKKHNKNNINFTIQNGKVKLNKLIKNRIIIENIEIFGNLVNNIATFNTSDAKFAKGILKANGTYNTKSQISEIDFSAEHIDADSTAGMVFNLYGQVKGSANANLKAIIKGNFKDINAKANFSIKDGYMPKLGESEFTVFKFPKIKKEVKMKLSNIIRMDVKKAKDLSSDLNGSFDIKNENIENIKIYSKQKYLSMYMIGNYNLEKEYANLQLFGNYNRIQGKRVKIIFVPLSVIIKLLFRTEYTKDFYKNQIKEIPPITSDKEETETFRIKFEGNLNSNNINVELKQIR